MPQSTTTVTPGNPTPPTKLSFVGSRPPLDPAQAAVDDGIPYFLSGGLLTNFMSLNETSASEANSLRVVFAAKTAAAGSGTSVDHEGKGNETLFTQTYGGNIYAPVVLQMDGCGPALTQGTMPQPNALHASAVAMAATPTLSTIAPNNVAHAPGVTSITLTGTNYVPSARVYIDGILTSCNYVSATSITVASAPNLNYAGTRTVTVQNGYGGPSASSTWTFT